MALLFLIPPVATDASGAVPHPTRSTPRNSTDLTNMAGDSFAYDVADHGELIFGNLGNPGQNQTWLQNPDAWINETGAIGPSARYWPAMAYDPALGDVILFGGESAGSAGGDLNDTWAYHLGAWTQLAPTGSPPVSVFELDREMVFDPDLGALVLVQSTVNASGPAGSSNLSTWSFSGTTWTQLGFQGVNASVTQGIFGNGLSYDAADHALVLPNALNFSTFNRDVLSFHSGRWTPSSRSGLNANASLWVAVGDPAQGGVVALGDLWFDLDTLQLDWPTFTGGSSGWTNITASAGQPTGLVVPFTASYDPNSSSVIVLGETLTSTPVTGPSIWTFYQGKWSGPSTPGFVRPPNPGGLVTALPWLGIGILVVVAAAAIAGIALLLRRRRRAAPVVSFVPVSPGPPAPPSPPA